MLRLRQIALVAHDLDAVSTELEAVLGLAIAHRDPAVGVFGLHNAVMPAGQQFIEVVAPTREDTAAGRYLERRAGDGGYMVILQCDDHAAVKKRVDELGIRKVVEQDSEHYGLMQLHPRDTGGSFLEIDVQIGGEDLDGPWEPAGPDWQAARTDTVRAIVAAELQSDDPEALASRWGLVLGRAVLPDDSGRPTIALDNASLRFVAADDGRGEGLRGIDVAVTSPDQVALAAARRNLPIEGGSVTLGGILVTPVPA